MRVLPLAKPAFCKKALPTGVLFLSPQLCYNTSMHTVSLFPHLLDYQMLGTFLLRVTLGFIFVRFSYLKIKNSETRLSHLLKNIGFRPRSIFYSLIPSILGAAGVLLVLGLYTQGAAIVTGTLTLVAAFNKARRSFSHPDNSIEFYILLSVASFALLFLGAGAFAVDLAV